MDIIKKKMSKMRDKFEKNICSVNYSNTGMPPLLRNDKLD